MVSVCLYLESDLIIPENVFAAKQQENKRGAMRAPSEIDRIVIVRLVRAAVTCEAEQAGVHARLTSFLVFLAELDNLASFSDGFNCEAEALQFLHQYAEAGRDTGFFNRLALDDGFIGFHAALNIVGLDGKHFLQGVGCAIGFQCPHFHFTEALTTKLCLTTQRLLGNKAVWASRTGMNLVLDEVCQLEHVHQTDCDRAIKGFTCAAIEQFLLAIDRNRMACFKHSTIRVSK